MGGIYLRVRIYNPGTGRFTTEDPARDGMNWYIYANNNPVKFKDPSGNVPIETFADFASAFYSAYDFFSDPSWDKSGYLIWDTLSVFIPYVPGSYSVRGVNYATKITEESVNDIAKNVAKNSSKIASQVDNIENEVIKKQSKIVLNNLLIINARNIAKNYKLTEKYFKSHIIYNHGVYSKVPNKSKFIHQCH